MFMGKIKYDLLKNEKNTKARLGILHTNYGDCETPMFMPVGTQATVKTLSPEEIKDMNCGVILSLDEFLQELNRLCIVASTVSQSNMTRIRI